MNPGRNRRTARPAQQRVNATPNPISLRVLVLEDDPVAAQVEIFELRRAGFVPEWQRVETLPDFEAALTPTPDVILADFELPTCNGLQALERLRQRQLDIPFILITGVLDDATAARCIGLGASDCLLKDRLARLGPAVTQALEQRHLRAEAAREERVMQLSEARYRRLFETAPDGILLLNSRDGRIVDVNSFLLRLLGHTRAELLGRRLWDVAAFRHLAGSEAAFTTLQAQDDIHYDRLPLVARDGRECPAEFIANACQFEGHRIIQCYFRDISRRTKAEQALAHAEERCTQQAAELGQVRDHARDLEQLSRSNERFELIARGAKDAVWDWDIPANTLWWNDNYYSLFGHAKEDTKPDLESWSDFLHPDDRERVLAGVHAVLDTGRTDWADEYRFRRRDGTCAHVLDRGLVVRDRDGRPVRMLGAMTDITTRKQAEAALHEKEYLLSETQRIAKIGSWKVKLNGMHLWSAETFRIFGVAPESISITTEAFVEQVHPDDRKSMQDWIAKCRAGENPEPLGFRIIRPDGTVRFLHGEGELIRDLEGKPSYLAGTVQDITARKQAEDNFRRVSDRLVLATNAANVGIWDWDLDQNKLVWDDAMYRLHGITPNQFAGAYEAWQAGVHPEDLARAEQEVQMALRGEREFDTEFRVVWPDQSVHHINAKAVVRRDATGQPVGMVGTNWDITERRKAEESLRKSNEELRHLFEHSPAVLYRLKVDGQNVVPVTANENVTRLLGFTVAETMRYEWWQQQLHPEDRERAEATVPATFATGASQSEYRLRRKDGDYRWVQDSRRLVRDASGRPTEMIGVWLDITERKEAESALREREERYLTILRTTMDGVWRVDMQGRLLEVNEAYCAMSGYGEQELLAMRVSDLEAVESPLAIAARIQNIRAQGEDRFESRHRRRDGSSFAVEVSIQYKPAEGGYMVAFLRNITERRRAEEQLKGQTEQLARSNEELARFNRLAAGRELRAIELKQQVNELAAQLGQPRPYPLAFLDATAEKILRTTPKAGEQPAKGGGQDSAVNDQT